MIASLLLLAVGLTDVARSLGRGATTRWTAVAVAWALVVGAGTGGLAVPVPAALGCVLAAAGWALVMPLDDRPRPRRLWPVVALTVAVAVLTAYDSTGEAATGFLVDAYDAAALPALDDVSARTALAAVAVGVFLTTSGNIVARAALGRAVADDAGDAAARDGAEAAVGVPGAPGTGGSPRPGWVVRVAGRVVGSVEPHASAAAGSTPRAAVSTLRGGRLIGPLERILVVVLALGGAEGIIAAVLAAKGIVRFPEISEDRCSGSKAEEFLIGSLASWSVSAAATVYLSTLASG